MTDWYHFEVKIQVPNGMKPPTDLDDLLVWLADPTQPILLDGALLTEAPANLVESS